MCKRGKPEHMATREPTSDAQPQRVLAAEDEIVAQRVARIESESTQMPLAELSQAVDALGRAFDEVMAHVSTELR